uniref:Protein max n=1 Tax=Oryzias sinensis TaxID=183150 RepID=A0A8C7XRR2_9TELE
MSDNDDIEVDSDADKRAHHNALERKRRDHIKDSFHSLRDSVPSLQGEKVGAEEARPKVGCDTSPLAFCGCFPECSIMFSEVLVELLMGGPPAGRSRTVLLHLRFNS